MSVLAIPSATLVSLVIALGFAAGLNVYATVFSLGLMARLHWIVLPTGLESLGNIWIIAVSGVLFAGEFFADKIPGFDLIWNALHTFVRIPIAALLAYEASSQLSPEAHLLVTCVGAAFATLAHGSKTAVRVAVTPSPEPVSNIGLSSAEDGVAIGLTYLAVHHPLTAGCIVGVLGAGSVTTIWFMSSKIRGWLRRRFGPRHAAGTV
jgi:Domain of unknown function (DUF4126)